MDLPHRLIVLFSFATFDLFSKAEQRSQRAQDRSRHWVPALDDRTERPNILGGGSTMNEYGLLPSGNIMNIYIYNTSIKYYIHVLIHYIDHDKSIKHREFQVPSIASFLYIFRGFAPGDTCSQHCGICS